MQTTVSALAAEVTGLKTEEMISILGVVETPFPKLQRETVQLHRDVLVDRSHRSLGPERNDRKPLAIIAKLHYYQHALVLRSGSMVRQLLSFLIVQ